MTILKIIFYGLLAFIERHPIFSLAVVLLAIFAPVVFKAIGWIIVAAILLILLVVCFGAYRLHWLPMLVLSVIFHGKIICTFPPYE